MKGELFLEEVQAVQERILEMKVGEGQRQVLDLRSDS